MSFILVNTVARVSETVLTASVPSSDSLMVAPARVVSRMDLAV